MKPRRNIKNDILKPFLSLRRNVPVVSVKGKYTAQESVALFLRDELNRSINSLQWVVHVKVALDIGEKRS